MKSLTSFYNTLYYQLCIKHFRPIDLLFCPFAKPFYSFKNTPIVSVIHDLQFMDYPSFFSEKERKERKNNMDEACRHATQFICISHFVKETILKYYPSCKQKINVIYITLENRFSHAIPDNEDSILHDLSLSKNNYLFYPANFWPHKNHSMLFSAFDHYRKKHPHSSLKLVCTGSSNQTKKEYQTLIQAMGLSSWIIFPGYLSDTTFFSLFKHARAIIYPSLYEGFGMPILEAMENGKPVLCSRVTSLPEIAGDAALFFNPTHLEEMIEAISKTEDPALMETLIVRGKKRAHFLKTQTQMAKEYWAIFKEVLN
jgi:glycosyltransferase involved in cell wall biosynthesis